MKRLAGWALLTAALTASALAQPKMKTVEPTSYVPGDTVDAGTFVLDREMKRHSLRELVRDDAKVVVLLILGGAALDAEDGMPRGNIWCGDTFDDFGIQRGLIYHFKDQPVQFIAVAVPPVYHADAYGYDDIFLTCPDDDPQLTEETRKFIEATEAIRRSGIIPFDDVYYDPKFRTAQNKTERELGDDFGTIYPWQGKLKWHMDPRRYGTPTIWLLDEDRRVLCEPFFGNDYDGDPPQGNYGFAELRREIERQLAEKE